MKGFVKWMDEAPLWLKIVFALLVLDLVWFGQFIASLKVWFMAKFLLSLQEFFGLLTSSVFVSLESQKSLLRKIDYVVDFLCFIGTFKL